MAKESRGYRVNLTELDQITARAAGFVGFLNESLTGLQQRIAGVQKNWNGAAADAQADAFRAWVAAAEEVLEGVDEMRKAARDAHDGYLSTIDTNLRMLGRR